jgi:hypothetical protein
MQEQQQSIEQAFSDLATIRRAIERVNEDENRNIVQRVVLGTNIYVQIGALAIALTFLISELVTNHLGTLALLYSAQDKEVAYMGLGNVGLFLLILLLFLYALVFRAARESHIEMGRFVARNFAYLKNFSLSCDLFVKYCLFALLVFAERPQWIAPMLVLFIGDYLLQGRFFTLPLNLSLVCGLLCVVGAIVQYYTGAALLAWPLAVFCVISVFSIGYLLQLKRSSAATTAEAK